MTDLTLEVQTTLAQRWRDDPSAALDTASEFNKERALLEQLDAIERRRSAGEDPYAGIPVAEFTSPVRLKTHAA